MMTKSPLSLRERIAQEKKRPSSAELSFEISQDLPRREPVELPPNPRPKSPSMPGRQIQYQKPVVNFVESTAPQFHRGPFSRRSYRRAAWSMVAAFVDAMVLIAISCFLLLSLRWVTPFKLTEFWSLAQQNYIFSISFAAVWIYFYMVMQRIFLGYSIGEWACGLRLGHLHQRFGSYYSLWVLWRMAAIFATGFVILPILSIFSGIDCAGWLSRLPIVESHEWNQSSSKAP